MADRFAAAAGFVNRVGLCFLFGGEKASELPNLHYEITGRDRIDEWGPDTELVWECRGTLPLRGVAWFGEWLKGRGTFIAARLIPAALAWCGVPVDEHACLQVAQGISPDAGLLYEALLTEGPLGSTALRKLVGMEVSEQSRPYQRALGALQRALLVTTYGSAQEGGSWPSSVFEPTVRAFPPPSLPGISQGLAALVAAYRSVSPSPEPARAARLLAAPLAAVSDVW